MRHFPSLALALCLLAIPVDAQTSISAKVKGMRSLPGYFPLYYDDKAGKLWLEIDRWGTEFLYYPSLPGGLGFNDIGLDRGQLGGEKVVRFDRMGPKVLLVQPNYEFRASSDNAVERQSVKQAFAESVIFGFKVEAEGEGRVLVDATDFYLRDAHGVIERLRAGRQGAFKLDPTRSALDAANTRNFPHNTEVEAILTFTSDDPGALVRSVAPSSESITVHQHHSFVKLPDGEYTPRLADPRSGFNSISFMDFSAPIGEPVTKRWITRHRLQRDASGKVTKPIIYYLDRGAPEPVRSALLEGARWWAEAFTAAGFPNAYRVELMPEGADPMDSRYNVIQWVHRSTRGWSYGSSIGDPRTGEIIKGHVTLGSLRDRQDYLIAEGLLAPYEIGKPTSPLMLELAIQRLRQLSAHEVGHTLGIQHNYISSAASRASVMDYPHPLATLTDAGAPDLSKMYTSGVGDWDKLAIAWGYTQFAPGAKESDSLSAMLGEGAGKGLRFITDSDSRPLGGAHPYSHLWDNGTNPADELTRLMGVRKRALERFGENNIRVGQPLATLEEVLVPLYLGHRYQIEAASKMVGGLDYSYSLRGDGSAPMIVVSGAEQRKAVQALLGSISPDALTLPPSVLRSIPPRPPGYPRTRETFRSRTGLTFDPLAAAEAAASLTLGQLLQGERAARLVQYHAQDASLPGLAEVIDFIFTATWKAPRQAGLKAEVQRVTETVALYHLMMLSISDTAPAQVRAIAEAKLSTLATFLHGPDPHKSFAARAIEQFRKDPKRIPLPVPIEAPPGQPI